jgi:hypothetical protein
VWIALVERSLYCTQSVHYPGLLQRTACGMESGHALLLMSRNLPQVTCRRCQATWRFKLGT